MADDRYDPHARWDDDAPPRPFADAPPPPEDVLPRGEVYDWYIRGADLLESGNPAAAVQLLTHAASAEPESRSVREALAACVSSCTAAAGLPLSSRSAPRMYQS